MVSEITVTNIVTGESVRMSADSDQFVLDYVDWDSPSVSMDSYRVPFQIGESLSGVTVGRRAPTIYGYVVSPIVGQSILGRTWDEYYREQEEGINNNKEILDRIFSVYQDVRIDAGDYHLDARPSSPVRYSATEEQNNEVLCYFAISLDCFRPMFYKDNVYTSLADTQELFHFPMIIPQSEGVVFGEIMKRQSIVIENVGDVPAGCEITIRASGGVVENPRVYSVTTGEYIEFDGVTLQDGDYIVITTNTGEENAVKHSISDSSEISVVGNMLDGSTFLQIEKGQGLYAYSVNEEQINNIEVLVSFVPEFFNIRGM